MNAQQIHDLRENRSGVAEIARQLENVKARKGFFNVAKLKAAGLIMTRKVWVHTSTYSAPTSETEFLLTAKGHRMLAAAHTVLLTIR